MSYIIVFNLQVNIDVCCVNRLWQIIINLNILKI